MTNRTNTAIRSLPDTYTTMETEVSFQGNRNTVHVLGLINNPQSNCEE
jgi:hypothetical protein